MTINSELLWTAAVVFPITLIILWGTRRRPAPKSDSKKEPLKT